MIGNQPSQNFKHSYLIYSTKTHFYLTCSLAHLLTHDYIKIQKQTCKLLTITKQQFNQATDNIKPFTAMLIIGIIILNSQIYLLFVSSAIAVFKQIINDQIYQIQDVYHLPFKNAYQYKSSKFKKNNEQILKFMEDVLFKKNFYFRYKSDITLSLQNTKIYQMNTNYKFFWNQNLVKIFKLNNTHLCWRIPIMQGYVYFAKLQKDSYYLMINRRSKIFSGPKLLCRGIYQDGQSVANFNQTQEIIKYKNDIFSYVSIRGTVPVYWSQNKGYIEFKNDHQNPQCFHSHLQSLQKAYPSKRIYFISWLNKEENHLRQKFDACFYHSNKYKYNLNDKYKLLPIDIDQNSKNVLYFLKQKITQSDVNIWFPYKDNFFWTVQQGEQQIIMAKQKLIYRVNCVDCTVRSNAIMMEISRKTMRDIEQFISIKKQQDLHYEQIQKIVAESWRELGNRISRLYCGQQEFQIGKKQQSSFFSMFTMYKDPMSQQFKQKAIDHLLNQVTPKQVLWIQKNLQRKFNIQQFSTISKLNFYIFSWNCNNLNPLSINQLSKQKLLNFNRGKIDVVIFSLQEMVQLNTYNVLITIDNQILIKWKQLILQKLNQKIESNEQKFDFISEENLVAITTWVFIKNKTKVKHYEKKQTTLVKTGFGNGIAGNKGAVIIFLKFDSQWISIVNCHLTAGQGKKIERKQSLQQILYTGLQDKYKQRMSQSDITFLIGDLNFRLQTTQQQIKNILNDLYKKINKQSLKMGLGIHNMKNHQNYKQLKKILSQLWQKDQLLNYKKRQEQILNRFNQGKLIFMPTYKYLKISHVNQYDYKRSPAWCDRILYQQKIKNIITPFIYQDIDLNLSDHKPVYAIFEVKIKKIINQQNYKKKFDQLKKDYYQSKQEIYKNKVHQFDFFDQHTIQVEINKTNQRKFSIHQTNNLKQPVISQNSQKMIQNENLLDINFTSIPIQKSSSPVKNDFLQFKFIAEQQIQKKNSKGSQNYIPLI